MLASPPPQEYNPHASTSYGALAQLVERLHRTQQVRGSNPLCSIEKGTHLGCLFYGAIPGLLPLPVAVSMPWFPCRIAGKVADGCKATWTNAQRLPRRGEPPRRSRWGGGESTARRIKRPRRYTHLSKKPNQKAMGQVLTLWNLIFYTKIRPHSINTLNR